MSDLKHFLRYQIPGLMFFVHLNAILYGLEILCEEQIIKLILPEVLIAVLVGWIIYQIYDTLNSSAHCMINSIDKVIDWAKMEKNKSNEIKVKHAIQIGLYSNIKQTKEKKDCESNTREKKDYELNMEELLKLLSSKFDHWGSRIINAYINAIYLSIYLILIFLNCCKLVKVNICFFYIISFVTVLILFFIAKKISTLKKELISYEGMLINLKEDEIMEATKL